MEKTLEERCKQCYGFIDEYYHFNKYYLNEVAKDALLNALDCMEMLAGEKTYLSYNYSGCDSHLPYIVQLATNPYLTKQTQDAFATAEEALIEVFVYRQETLTADEVDPWEDFDWCYECTGYGDDYSVGDDGELHSNCERCPHNKYKIYEE